MIIYDKYCECIVIIQVLKYWEHYAYQPSLFDYIQFGSICFELKGKSTEGLTSSSLLDSSKWLDLELMRRLDGQVKVHKAGATNTTMPCHTFSSFCRCCKEEFQKHTAKIHNVQVQQEIRMSNLASNDPKINPLISTTNKHTYFISHISYPCSQTVRSA